jgi:transcriptional regulator with XRE-family HTH domain
LAKAVKAWRVARGMLSQEALAAAAGVAIKTVGTLERGQKISDTKMRQIEQALGRPPYTFDAILGGAPVPGLTGMAPWIAELVAMSPQDINRIADLYDKYRPGDGDGFKIWATGVRQAHGEGQESKTRPATERDAG